MDEGETPRGRLLGERESADQLVEEEAIRGVPWSERERGRAIAPEMALEGVVTR